MTQGSKDDPNSLEWVAVRTTGSIGTDTPKHAEGPRRPGVVHQFGSHPLRWLRQARFDKQEERDPQATLVLL